MEGAPPSCLRNLFPLKTTLAFYHHLELRKPTNDDKLFVNLYAVGKESKWKIFFPKMQYTTDNAAMIAVVGYLKYKESITSDLSCSATARYKI